MENQSVLFQVHNYHDSLVAYAGLIQLVTMMFSASLLLFVGWLRRGGWWRIGLSLLLVIVADLTYEAACGLVVMHIAVAYAEGRRLRTAAGHVAISVAFVLMTIVLRTQNGTGGSGQYSINASPDKVISALARELSAALPMANFLDPGGPRFFAATNSHTPALRGILIALLLAPLLWAAARAARRWQPPVRLILGVLVACAALALLPSGLVALAPRYQQDLRWGVGYLPVFMEVVAVAILAALAYCAAARKLPAIPLVAVCALLIGFAASKNAEGSSRVVAVQQPVAFARDELEDAFRHGVLDDAPADGLLLMDQAQISPPAGPWIASYNWDLSNWIYTHIDRWYRALPMAEAAPLARQCQNSAGAPARCAVQEGPVTWFTTAAGPGGRWILLSPLRTKTLSARTNLYTAVAADRARLTIRSTSPATIQSLQILWTTDKGSPTATPGSALRRVRRSGRWTTFAVPVPPRAIASSAVVAAASAT